LLERFFRDHAKRAELATPLEGQPADSRCIADARPGGRELLLGLCQEQIDSYGNPERAIDGEDLELLAESLSGLGFYVEAMEQQRPDPATADRTIARQAPGRGARRARRPPRRRRSKHAVEEMRNACRALVAEVHRAPADAAARGALKAELGDLLNDAKLIDDSELVAQASRRSRARGGRHRGARSRRHRDRREQCGRAARRRSSSEETQRLLAPIRPGSTQSFSTST
jgi:chemosensory pili system protein ChpA (sensor histidine kinase/response regulator)